MTANLRTSIKQKITPFIKSFVASDMYELDSTMDVKGQQVSRFRLFLNAIGVDDKTQDETDGLYADTKRELYGGMITDYIKQNSESMTKGTKKDPPKKKEDNIGRKKLFEIMKKYILKNPNDPRFNLSQQIQESKEPELEPELKDGPALAQADAKDQANIDPFNTNDITAYLESQEKSRIEKATKLNVAIEKYKDLTEKKKALDQFRSQSKLFGLSESKRLVAEKKSETKAQARKAIAEKLKQDIKRLKEEAKAEAKAKARAIVGNRRGMSSEDINRVPPPEEKKIIPKFGTIDILRAQQTVQPVPAFTVIPPLVSTPAPVPAPQAEVVLEQPQEVKQSQESKQRTEAKKRQRVEGLKVQGMLRRRQDRQPIQEQKQELELDQVGLDADAEVQSQQQREDRLQRELEQAQQLQEQPQRVSRSEKEQEVKILPARTRMSDYLLQQLGGATFSALASVLATRARRTGDSDLGGYTTMVGGILGSAVYNSAMRLYPDIFNDIISEVNEYFGVSPQDIIKEARATPPQGPPEPQGPQGTIDDIKGEGKHDSAPSSNIYRDTTPEQIDAFRASQGQPPANRGPIAMIKGLGGAGLAYVQDAVARKYNDVKSSLDPQEYDENGRSTKYDIRGNPIKYDENGFRINPLLEPEDPNEEVLFDDENDFLTFDRSGNDLVRPRYRMGGILGNRPLRDYEDARNYDGSRPTRASRIRELIERSKRVVKDNEKNIITGGSALAGATAIGAGIAGAFSKQQPRIKENPLIFKQEQTTQGDGETNVERGAGKLKPKFIVPSANIFNKTEQEQYVDDIEFAMFDFVQDEGGNDPYGTNPLLRDQHITDGLRYQRAGVNVYSLYGANLPDNPKNMPLKKMQEMFLGENRLPEMKFLFSNEFEAQEFNQSEFEVDEYDVNNERTAIEAYSPYANFTNNQLLDQFYDTSVLYGVVP